MDFCRKRTVVLNTTPEEIGESRYQTYREGVNNFNEVIDSGRLRLEKQKSQSVSTTQQSTFNQGSEYVLVPNSDSAPSAEAPKVEAAVSAASCNRSDVVITDPGTIVPGEVWVDIYLSDGNIRDINAIVGLGGVTGPIVYDYLSSQGYLVAGALAGPAATAVTVAVAAEWAWIQVENDGCGVKITTGYSPVNPSYQVPTVESQ